MNGVHYRVQPDQNNRSIVTFTLMSKSATETPYGVVKKEWFDQLSAKQQEDCEITTPDEPIEYFKEGENKGQPMNEDAPNPTPHKTRYRISTKQAVFQEMLDKYGGLEYGPYDYRCGHTVGTLIDNYPPYFEFDDRSPDKYLFVRSFGLVYGDWGIDLDSITF
jgi:hypothetical protein